MNVGALRCEVSGGLGLIITSSKEMQCVFTSARGHREHYYGTIRKFGLDIGATDQGVLAWDVFAPSEGPERGALAGDYAGVDASATLGPGLARTRSSAALAARSRCSLCRFKRRLALLSPPKLAFSCARWSSAAAKEENPTTLD